MKWGDQNIQCTLNMYESKTMQDDTMHECIGLVHPISKSSESSTVLRYLFWTERSYV